MIKVDTLNMF